MALRAVLDHPKFNRLKALLKANKCSTLGYLEGLWHFTGRFTPNGNITAGGKYSVEDIEAWLEWDGAEGALIAAMVRARWIDDDPVHGLIVHDWHVHADDATKLALKRREVPFCVPTASGQTNAPRDPVAMLTAHIQPCPDSVPTASLRCSDSIPTTSGLPEPEPEPVPEFRIHEIENNSAIPKFPEGSNNYYRADGFQKLGDIDPEGMIPEEVALGIPPEPEQRRKAPEDFASQRGNPEPEEPDSEFGSRIPPPPVVTAAEGRDPETQARLEDQLRRLREAGS